MSNENLTLQEALLLLCLNDDTGKFEVDYLRYVLNAAALAELLRQRRITLEAGRVIVTSTAPVGDELLEVALSRLVTTTRARKLTYWMRVLYRDRRLPIEVLTTRLLRRGILTRREARVLWVFRRTVYPTRDPGPEQAVRDRIQGAMLRGGNADETTAILVALLQGCRALRLVVERAALKKLKPVIQAICASSPTGEAIGRALAATIAEDETAAAVAVMVAGSGS